MKKYLLILACGLLLVGCTTKKVFNSTCPACECEKYHGDCEKVKHCHPEHPKGK